MMSNKTTVESEYKICNGNRDYFEIFHVKLTDSALKSLENFSRRQVCLGISFFTFYPDKADSAERRGK